jgi:hypothetical protein
MPWVLVKMLYINPPIGLSLPSSMSNHTRINIKLAAAALDLAFADREAKRKELEAFCAHGRKDYAILAYHAAEFQAAHEHFVAKSLEMRHTDEFRVAVASWAVLPSEVKDSVEPDWFGFGPKERVDPVADGIMACAYVNPETGKEEESCCYVLFQSEYPKHWWVASCRRGVVTFRLISADRFTAQA